MTHRIEGTEAHWPAPERMFAACVEIHPRKDGFATALKLTSQFLITMAALAMFVASIAFIVEQVK